VLDNGFIALYLPLFHVLCCEDFMAGLFTLSVCVATALCATGVSGDPMLVDTSSLVDDESFAALLSAQKSLAAAPAGRNLAVADAATCGMDISGGAADLLQVGLGLWSAVKVCETAEKGSDANKMACVADISGIVASLTNIGQYIIGIMESCGGKVSLNDHCARASLVLAGAISGAAGTSTALSAGCGNVQEFKLTTQVANGASCVVDVRSTVQSLLKTIMSLVAIKKNCDVSAEQCSTSGAHLVASLAGLAEFVLAATGDCAGKLVAGAACASDVAKLVSSLSTTVAAATDTEMACNPNAPTPGPAAVEVLVQPDGTKTSPQGVMTSAQAAAIAEMKKKLNNFQRLYQPTAERTPALDEESHSLFSSTAVLAGFMPLLVIMGFLAGRRSKSGDNQQPSFRKVSSETNAREFLDDAERPIVE